MICLCKGRICRWPGESTGVPVQARGTQYEWLSLVFLFCPLRMSYDPAKEKLGRRSAEPGSSITKLESLFSLLEAAGALGGDRWQASLLP